MSLLAIETKKAISRSLTGKKHSAATKEKLRRISLNMSEATKAKMSVSASKRRASLEKRAKTSETMKGRRVGVVLLSRCSITMLCEISEVTDKGLASKYRCSPTSIKRIRLRETA